MAKNALKKQKQYEQDMRDKAKQGLINRPDGTFGKPNPGGADQMHMSGALHRKV